MNGRVRIKVRAGGAAPVQPVPQPRADAWEQTGRRHFLTRDAFERHRRPVNPPATSVIDWCRQMLKRFLGI